jgi:adenosylcobyric acid synthase
MTGRALMVCGTSSHAGKSVIVAGLCRAFWRRGVHLAPFKGQNMALNAAVSTDGGEIGRAQAFQAIAARTDPSSAMNPVLLKPTGERSSEVIVRGLPWKTLDAASFQRAKADLVEVVDGALAELRGAFDLVVCEGAGSPAEINLLGNDLVNLGLAHRAQMAAIVVGDIDRGGVFAHLYGTVALVPDDLRPHIRGLVINKFRGDPALLADGPDVLAERTGVPVVGVLPWLGDLAVDAEDSLALDGRFGSSGAPAGDVLDVAVLRLPTISNFTDLDPLAFEPGVSVRLVQGPAGLGRPDLVVLPGSKRTVADLAWLRASRLADALGTLCCGPDAPGVLGICGGYQMLGTEIRDPEGIESAAPVTEGLGLLDVTTRFATPKWTRVRHGTVEGSALSVGGYEIRYGRPERGPGADPWFALDGDSEGAVDHARAVYGTSLHGVFEHDAFRVAFLGDLARRRGLAWEPGSDSFAAARERELDRLADACEAHLDLDLLWAMSEGVA